MTDTNEENLIKRAPELALKKARMYGTTLIVERNGKIVELSPDEFEESLKNPPKE